MKTGPDLDRLGGLAFVMFTMALVCKSLWWFVTEIIADLTAVEP